VAVRRYLVNPLLWEGHKLLLLVCNVVRLLLLHVLPSAIPRSLRAHGELRMLRWVYAVQWEMWGDKRPKLLPVYGVNNMFPDVRHSHTFHDSGRAAHPELQVRQLPDGVHLLHAAAGMYLYNHRDANKRRLH